MTQGPPLGSTVLHGGHTLQQSSTTGGQQVGTQQGLGGQGFGQQSPLSACKPAHASSVVRAGNTLFQFNSMISSSKLVLL